MSDSIAEVTPFPGLQSLDSLETEICDLAARIAVATCTWLKLLADFDRREGWRRSGCRSAAQWLSWRCGLSLAAAYEHIRVARALVGLPRIAAEFGAGRLSYSKVRALTRIAGTEPVDAAAEEDLLVLAKSSTAAQLDRLASGCVRARAAGDARHTMRRQLRWWYDDDGSLVIRGRLAAEEGAVFVAALEAAMDRLHKRNSMAAGADRTGADRTGADRTGADRTGADRTGADRTGADSARDGRPHSSAEESSARSGPTPSCPWPPLHRAAVAADALVLMAETLLTHTPAFANSSDKYRVLVHVDASTLAGPAPAAADASSTATGGAQSGSSSGTQCRLDDGHPLSPETARRLACDASVVGLIRSGQRDVLSIGDATRFPSSATARAVRIRDDNTCVAPSCTTRRGLQIHHVRHWAQGGATRLDNLVLVCRFHHWLVHEGGFNVTSGRQGYTFHRPDGSSIDASPGLAVVDDPTDGLDVTDVKSILRRATATFDGGGEGTLTPPWWSGDPLELDYAVSVVLDAQERRWIRLAA